ncbi:hypothetical protein [Acidovorax sp. BL-A-41-H1]|uniref:hypothetical protein n=1 Tax=Acidovorax sp. BL-A-41-H1 TaxID=3421102 RepID=UPI003F78F765
MPGGLARVPARTLLADRFALEMVSVLGTLLCFVQAPPDHRATAVAGIPERASGHAGAVVLSAVAVDAVLGLVIAGVARARFGVIATHDQFFIYPAKVQ